ncbi:hypothetical protein JMJ35_001800 [Cladonia borealis]|uniref:Uncharacterized protein n=1 Tax=Cladonia borealis TaxID=184061 RepID=A0AA39R960_9LECA|nr:hypothetical protein JMJ35_001800 [Cladonia borealis]
MANGLDIMPVDEMDVDMDIDLGPIDVFAEGDLDELNTPQSALTVPQSQSNGNGAILHSGIGSEAEITPLKIHMYGLNDLTTSDIEAFAAEHFPSRPPTKVEWIDDSSANIVFEDEATTVQALEQFSLASEIDVTQLPNAQLRRAKPLSTHPESDLQVRIAFTTDQKRPRAYEASRFYMMHPEHDPREKRRRGERTNHYHTGDYRRKRYNDEEHRRRKRNDAEDGFDASMYDDNGPSSRRGSTDSFSDIRSSDGGRRSRHRGDSYRPARNRASRDRSASPGRSRRTPPPSYRTRDPHPFPQENKGKELFPSKSEPNGNLTQSGKDLFSNKLLAAGLKKELFPHKANVIIHRRSDAFDAADETADLFANRLSVPFKTGRNEGKSLADRITNVPAASNGRLNASDPEPVDNTPDMEDTGFSIRGGSSLQDKGFSIRGSAAAGTIKELFPGKAVGNAGKELFAEKLQGRGGRRNRAEDMFY